MAVVRVTRGKCYGVISDKGPPGRLFADEWRDGYSPQDDGEQQCTEMSVLQKATDPTHPQCVTVTPPSRSS